MFDLNHVARLLIFCLPDISVLCLQGENAEETAVSQEGVPAGYEAVTLIEALNGQCVPPPGEGMVSPH